MAVCPLALGRRIQQINFEAQYYDNLPSYWHLSRSNRGQSQNYVEAGERSKSAITDAIIKTWDPNSMGQGKDARGLTSCRINVLSIKRLENPWLYSNYQAERQKLLGQCRARRKTCPDIQKLPGSSGRVLSTEVLPDFMKGELNWRVNEVYLFHGTKAGNIESIKINGLDPRYSNPFGMFGQAIYTTESSTKADQYTDLKDARSDSGSDLYMILARVLLGRVFVCDSRTETLNLRGPPCTSCYKHSCTCRFPSRFRYDSIMADGDWMFREFAIHHENRCYPEYIIKYRRADERMVKFYSTRNAASNFSRGPAFSLSGRTASNLPERSLDFLLRDHYSPPRTIYSQYFN